MFKTVTTGLALAVAVVAGPVWADDYPDHPVRIIHGFGPGGNADTVARILAEGMTEKLGQPFVVEPKPGAGGQVASAFVAGADPDGYTLELLVGGHSVAGALYKKLNYDSIEDFTFLNRISFFPFFIATKAGAYEDITALIAKGKDGGRVKFGSAGTGTTQHLTGELLGKEAEAKFLHIPYKGDAGAVTALLGGEVDMVVAAGTSVLSQAAAGELDLLAVSWDRPWLDTPDVPTLTDTVAPGFNVFSWLGLGAPAGLPDEITAKLAEVSSEIILSDKVTEQLAALGGVASPMAPEDFRAMVADQIDTWNEVIDAVGIDRK